MKYRCTWDRRKLLLGQFVRPQLKFAYAGTATVISLPQPGTMHTSLPQSSLAAHCLSSAHLPCLRPKAPSRTQFCFRMLLQTTDWPCYHRRLDVLFTNSRIHPSASASSCAPSSHLYTDLFCLLVELLAFEDLPLGIPVATENCCWLDIAAVMARFIRCVPYSLPQHLPAPLLAPFPPPLLQTLLLPRPVWIDHLPLPPLSFWVLLLKTPRPLSQSLSSCYSPLVPCMFDALDPVNDDEVPIPCLHVPSPKQPSAHAAAASLEDSDDKLPISLIPPRSCDVDEVLIPHPVLSRPPSPPCPPGLWPWSMPS
jgi:hypothetical protein